MRLGYRFGFLMGFRADPLRLGSWDLGFWVLDGLGFGRFGFWTGRPSRNLLGWVLGSGFQWVGFLTGWVFDVSGFGWVGFLTGRPSPGWVLDVFPDRRSKLQHTPICIIDTIGGIRGMNNH